jgi:hypothetical protein
MEIFLTKLEGSLSFDALSGIEGCARVHCRPVAIPAQSVSKDALPMGESGDCKVGMAPSPRLGLDALLI